MAMKPERRNLDGCLREVLPALLFAKSSTALVTAIILQAFRAENNFSNPETVGICVDSTETFTFPACENRVYKWTTNGTTTLFAGSGNSGSGWNWKRNFNSFNQPGMMACDSADNIYVWDSGNARIRRINQNRDVVTIAGLHFGNFDGSGTNAGFRSISAMCVDGSGNVIMACGTKASVKLMLKQTW